MIGWLKPVAIHRHSLTFVFVRANGSIHGGAYEPEQLKKGLVRVDIINRWNRISEIRLPDGDVLCVSNGILEAE